MNGLPRRALRRTDDLLPNHGETSVMSYFRLTRVAAALVPFAPFLMSGCASLPSADTAKPSETAAVAAAAAHAATTDATSARNGATPRDVAPGGARPAGPPLIQEICR